MKKCVYSILVMAIFAIGFAASDDSESSTSQAGQKNAKFAGTYTLYDGEGEKVKLVVTEDGRLFSEKYEIRDFLGKIEPLSENVFQVWLEANLSMNGIDKYCNNEPQGGWTSYGWIPHYTIITFDVSTGKMYPDKTEYDNRDMMATSYCKFRFTH